MSRILLAACLALFSGTSLGQMMAAPISTARYFPLVDGARYEYMFTRGEWSSAVAEMHGSQTWAGIPGLVARRTTYTCAAGAACAPDATDFFRLDPDGFRYFGGTGAMPDGMQFFMQAFTSPEWVLKNPVTPGTMMDGGGWRDMDMWSSNVTGTHSMMGGQAYTCSFQALALETVATPAGTFAGALHVRQQCGPDSTRDIWYAPDVGMVRMDDATHAALLTAYTIPGAAQPGGAAPLAFVPATGLWWNPAESGTGYNIQVQHGVAVAIVFSYAPTGEALWYLASGPLANAGGGVAFTGHLDRYYGGQCVACSYRKPALTGNDGDITIAFGTPTTATVRLPGGRVTAIVPQSW
jgi:hypothetical protein